MQEKVFGIRESRYIQLIYIVDHTLLSLQRNKLAGWLAEKLHWFLFGLKNSYFLWPASAKVAQYSPDRILKGSILIQMSVLFIDECHLGKTWLFWKEIPELHKCPKISLISAAKERKGLSWHHNSILHSDLQLRKLSGTAHSLKSWGKIWNSFDLKKALQKSKFGFWMHTKPHANLLLSNYIQTSFTKPISPNCNHKM